METSVLTSASLTGRPVWPSALADADGPWTGFDATGGRVRPVNLAGDKLARDHGTMCSVCGDYRCDGSRMVGMAPGGVPVFQPCLGDQRTIYQPSASERAEAAARYEEARLAKARIDREAAEQALLAYAPARARLADRLTRIRNDIERLVFAVGHTEDVELLAEFFPQTWSKDDPFFRPGSWRFVRWDSAPIAQWFVEQAQQRALPFGAERVRNASLPGFSAQGIGGPYEDAPLRYVGRRRSWKNKPRNGWWVSGSTESYLLRGGIRVVTPAVFVDEGCNRWVHLYDHYNAARTKHPPWISAKQGGAYRPDGEFGLIGLRCILDLLGLSEPAMRATRPGQPTLALSDNDYKR